jgi:hypothetical protein
LCGLKNKVDTNKLFFYKIGSATTRSKGYGRIQNIDLAILATTDKNKRNSNCLKSFKDSPVKRSVMKKNPLFLNITFLIGHVQPMGEITDVRQAQTESI